MEIKQYYLLARKWAWLLILGAILGAGAAYGFSTIQPVIYQTSTQIMVSQAQDQVNQNYYNAYYDIQLAENYARIINTSPVLSVLSEKLGNPLEAGISVKQAPDTNMLVLTVTGSEPTRITEIANTLVSVFIEYVEGMQDENYKSTEENLKTQITQIEEQIATLQTEMSALTETTEEILKQQRDEQAKEISAMLTSVEEELLQIEIQLETFIPTPAITNTPAPGWIRPTSTPVPVATPTLSSADDLKYRELEIRRDQLNEMRNLFMQAYGNLLVMNENPTSDPTLLQNQLQTTLALYQQIYSNLLSSYENVRLARLRSTPNIMVIEPAQVPTTPIQPQPIRNALLGGVSGIMVMGAIAFLIEYLDDTLKTPEDVTRYLNLPVIGLIGDMGYRKGRKRKIEPGIFVSDNPLSPVTEAFRTLRANLDFASVDKPLRTVLVTSAGPSEGKSTLAINLAAVMAQGGRRVFLLDADLRRPSIHRYLGFSNNRGLSNLFHEPREIVDMVYKWRNPQMAVITSGKLPPNPAELMASEKMRKILEGLKHISDIVVIDTPPAMMSDVIALSPKVDGILFVIEPGKTRIGSAQVVMEQFQRAGARVVGVVLNPIVRRDSNYYSKYSYYSSYYYSREDQNSFRKNSGDERKTEGK